MISITPRVDIAFKKIFGVEENKDLLISLINAIVSADDQVSDLILLNPYNPKNFRNDKLSILDIKAQGVDGKRFNIEIQIADEADYDKRALYYWAKLYTEQLKEVGDYVELAKSIVIHILNFTSIPESDKYHNVFHITEKENGITYFKDLELHTIELRKFTEGISNDLVDLVAKIKSSLDIWVAFLTKYNLFERGNLPASLAEHQGLSKALHVLEVMNFNQAEREDYDDHLKWLRIQTSTIRNYEQRGELRGFEHGFERGFDQGIDQGIEQGQERKAQKMAIMMLQENESVEKISRFTGLTLDTISTLKINLANKPYNG